MDYEKKYNEALERAKDVKNGPSPHDSSVATVEYIFPELCESEDERIRKEMIAWLKTFFGKKVSVVYTEDEIRERIAYLERQKEPKPEEPISKETCLNEMLKNGQISLSDYLSLTKEQKPVEKQDYSGLNDFERAIHRGFLCAGVENVPVTIIKETAQDCLAHLPAEWSEEDEKIMQTMIKEGDLKPSEIAWLKSLRPSWKPTQEQMEALLVAIHWTPSDENMLISLYNDLKKL